MQPISGASAVLRRRLVALLIDSFIVSAMLDIFGNVYGVSDGARKAGDRKQRPEPKAYRSERARRLKPTPPLRSKPAGSTNAFMLDRSPTIQATPQLHLRERKSWTTPF